jgi:hypothetical protein
VVGLVEATGYEGLCIWREYHEEMKKSWAQVAPGLLETIGHVGDMPVCLSLSINVVDGHRILFWETTSQVVDHRMVEDWFVRTMPKTALREDGKYLNKANAMNFHNVIHCADRKPAAAILSLPDGGA